MKIKMLPEIILTICILWALTFNLLNVFILSLWNWMITNTTEEPHPHWLFTFLPSAIFCLRLSFLCQPAIHLTSSTTHTDTHFHYCFIMLTLHQPPQRQLWPHSTLPPLIPLLLFTFFCLFTFASSTLLTPPFSAFFIDTSPFLLFPLQHFFILLFPSFFCPPFLCMKESLCGHTEGQREQGGRETERQTSKMDVRKEERHWRGEHMKEERGEGKMRRWRKWWKVKEFFKERLSCLISYVGKANFTKMFRIIFL